VVRRARSESFDSSLSSLRAARRLSRGGATASGLGGSSGGVSAAASFTGSSAVSCLGSSSPAGGFSSVSSFAAAAFFVAFLTAFFTRFFTAFFRLTTFLRFGFSFVSSAVDGESSPSAVSSEAFVLMAAFTGAGFSADSVPSGESWSGRSSDVDMNEQSFSRRARQIR